MSTTMRILKKRIEECGSTSPSVGSASVGSASVGSASVRSASVASYSEAVVSWSGASVPLDSSVAEGTSLLLPFLGFAGLSPVPDASPCTKLFVVRWWGGGEMEMGTPINGNSASMPPLLPALRPPPHSKSYLYLSSPSAPRKAWKTISTTFVIVMVSSRMPPLIRNYSTAGWLSGTPSPPPFHTAGFNKPKE